MAGRPTDKPRLASLDPDAVGREVHEAVMRQAARLATVVGQSLVEAGPSDLAITAGDLCRYAQTGALGDCGDPEGALDAAQEICEALYSQAGAPGTFDLGELPREADPESAIGLVLVAALARVEIARGRPVTTRQLGALAGMDRKSIELLARKAEIALWPTGVDAAEARRWLSARGVPGFNAR